MFALCLNTCAIKRAFSYIFDPLCAGRQFGVKRDLEEYGADVHGVRQMIIYGLKGMGSYARHARLLGEWDDSIGAFTSEVTALFCPMWIPRLLVNG